MSPLYQPDFDAECRICSTSPCVLVINHTQPSTELCGLCFFSNPRMLHWEDWNDNESDEPSP